MRDFIYLKTVKSEYEVIGDKTTFSTTFQVVFSDKGKGLEDLYRPRLRKYIKKYLAPDLNRKTLEFTISKSAKLAEGDTDCPEFAKRITRVKVEIAACRIKEAIIEKTISLLKETIGDLDKCLLDTKFREAGETGYLLDSILA